MSNKLYYRTVEKAKELVNIYFLLKDIIYNCPDDDYSIIIQRLDEFKIECDYVTIDDKQYIKTRYHIIDPTNKTNYIEEFDKINEVDTKCSND